MSAISLLATIILIGIGFWAVAMLTRMAVALAVALSCVAWRITFAPIYWTLRFARFGLLAFRHVGDDVTRFAFGQRRLHRAVHSRARAPVTMASNLRRPAP